MNSKLEISKISCTTFSYRDDIIIGLLLSNHKFLFSGATWKRPSNVLLLKKNQLNQLRQIVAIFAAAPRNRRLPLTPQRTPRTVALKNALIHCFWRLAKGPTLAFLQLLLLLLFAKMSGRPAGEKSRKRNGKSKKKRDNRSLGRHHFHVNSNAFNVEIGGWLIVNGLNEAILCANIAEKVEPILNRIEYCRVGGLENSNFSKKCDKKELWYQWSKRDRRQRERERERESPFTYGDYWYEATRMWVKRPILWKVKTLLHWKRVGPTSPAKGESSEVIARCGLTKASSSRRNAPSSTRQQPKKLRNLKNIAQVFSSGFLFFDQFRTGHGS